MNKCGRPFEPAERFEGRAAIDLTGNARRIEVNLPDAHPLRCAYQSTAASASSSSAGWIRRDSTLIAPVGREGALARHSRRSAGDESISAERASGGRARASRSRSAGWLSIFHLLVRLKVFNTRQMDQAVFTFRRYEDASLRYTGTRYEWS
jgi:hypothetical protein